ncbi:MAG: deoxyribonuclease IV [Anaerolineae bacterium]|nr:deoxyribonuclease IV [Anaerolineae bacterium]
MRLGAHMSIAGGVDKAVERGASIGCETIQIFVKSPNRWAPRKLPPDEIERFREWQEQTGIRPIFAHDSYLVNVGSPDDALWERSLASLLEEVEHSEELGLPYLVMHPGAHMDAGVEAGLDRVARAIDVVHERTPGYRVRILLETTAGAGTVLGRRFEELRGIIDRVKEPGRLAVCFDTCHVFASGYDLRTREAYEQTMRELERIIGRNRVLAFHLNDSRGGLGSHIDRHENIGEGQLGLDGFRWLLNDPRWADRPMVIETEKSEDMHEDVENLRRLRSLIEA